jgi:shikimate dehydrogenase
MHDGEMQRRGMAGSYVAYDVTEEQFGDFLAQSRGTALRGLSVTMPLKDAAFDLVDIRDDFAQRSRSVNTITFAQDGRMRGSDTDGRGCVEALARFGCVVAGKRCMVLGAGGTARSIVVALDFAGAQEVLVVNRSIDRAKEAAACAVTGRVASVDEASVCDVIVNATPVGMDLANGNVNASPIDSRLISQGACVLDAVYNPLATQFLRQAADRGATTVDGLWMLVHQAVLQQAEWFGAVADADSMRASAEAELARR